jgi:penicillin-binding protein 2
VTREPISSSTSHETLASSPYPTSFTNHPSPVTSHYYHDWRSFAAGRTDEPVANTRSRLRWILGVFVLAAVVVFSRAVQLELSDGANFRRLASRPIERRVTLAPPRGRIVARDGTVLAADRTARALAVQFRYLESPSNPAWLRRLARSRLKGTERRDAQRITEAEEALRNELAELHARLARLCDLSLDRWQARTRRIQNQVDAVATRVNARRVGEVDGEFIPESPSSDVGLSSLLLGLFAPPEQLPRPPIVIVEQTAFHHVVDDVPAKAAAEIQQNPDRWPGVKIVEHVRRDYPHGMLAANIVGHVTKTTCVEPSGAAVTASGLMGLERAFDQRLAGREGLEVRQTDRRGNVLGKEQVRQPIAGQDVALSIDPRLQKAAEAWLDRRTRASRTSDAPPEAHSGALVVMDVDSGELLVAASSPRFDPNLFASGDERVETVLRDPRRPLFDRASKMAIAPGSAFKPLTAIALLEQRIVDPLVTFHCQGFLKDPDRLRCQLFRQHGIGHGELTLADALAQSCNVYFFHHAGDLGATPLVQWAAKFGFGQPSGVELPDESAGQLPNADDEMTPGQAQLLAIGQGAIAATPLQLVRMYAAIANGGRLVTPQLCKEAGGRRPEAEGEMVPNATSGLQSPASSLVLDHATLPAVREGLLRVVNDPNGTAYATARVAWPVVAGKTGTAETGRQADHAWFAGYAPADAPRYAFVVVLEHGGNGSTAAGSIARDLVVQMRELGYFGTQPIAERPIPPGKG